MSILLCILLYYKIQSAECSMIFGYRYLYAIRCIRCSIPVTSIDVFQFDSNPLTTEFKNGIERMCIPFRGLLTQYTGCITGYREPKNTDIELYDNNNSWYMKWMEKLMCVWCQNEMPFGEIIWKSVFELIWSDMNTKTNIFVRKNFSFWIYRFGMIRKSFKSCTWIHDRLSTAKVLQEKFADSLT